jgi:hypothetical protein
LVSPVSDDAAKQHVGIPTKASERKVKPQETEVFLLYLFFDLRGILNDPDANLFSAITFIYCNNFIVHDVQLFLFKY